MVCAQIWTLGTCDKVFHLQCLDPPLAKVPDGDWSCPVCLAPTAAGLDEAVAAAADIPTFNPLAIERQWLTYVTLFHSFSLDLPLSMLVHSVRSRYHSLVAGPTSLGSDIVPSVAGGKNIGTN